MKPRLVVTTSWDDGHPADMRLAELLAKYGVAGTFYVPNRNAEGRPVLSAGDVKELSTRFEIGGHSVDHMVLTGLANDEAERQIVENKRWLENVTSKPVRGFCYVRGRYNRTLKDIVRRSGFEYARTVENLHSSMPADAFEMPTTIQLYPHNRISYLKNFARGRLTSTRARQLWVALASEDLAQRLERLVGLCESTGGYFHLWGHSWEIEERNLWGVFEAILARLAAAATSIDFMTNYQVCSKVCSNIQRVRQRE